MIFEKNLFAMSECTSRNFMLNRQSSEMIKALRMPSGKCWVPSVSGRHYDDR